MLNFEDHDWEELGAPPGTRDTAAAWKLAAGVAIGMLMGGLLVYVVDHGMAQRSLSEAAQALEQIVHAADTPATGRPRPVPPAAQPPLARLDQRDLSAPTMVERAQPTSAGAAAPELGRRALEPAPPGLQQADEQRELAWARYYVKPAYCDVNPGRDTLVECANHFIRARREFEAAYTAGRR